LHKDIYNSSTKYGISIMTKLHTNKMTSRRAVAPVIATLLLVAIAVVGGSIIFVFSQGFFSSAQISGSPQIESVKILGYDATDGNATQFHDGFVMNSTLMGNTGADGLNAEEYVAVYLKNDSVNKITLSEILLAGTPYTYVDLGGDQLPAYTTGLDNIGLPEYTIVEEGWDGTASGYGLTIDASAPELQPGQQATVVLALEKDVKTGRDLQFKLTTTSGAVFVGTINTGQQSG
jgi:flagellin-like protein